MVKQKASREGPTVRVCWKDGSPNHMDCTSRKLASAILFQALADGQKGSQEARKWIQEGGTGFRFWCGVYGIKANTASRCLKKAIRTAPITRERRKEMIFQTLIQHPKWSNRKISRHIKVNHETVRQIRKRMPQALAR